MKDYNIIVNFQDGSVESNFMELVQNDYNTTTLNFKFDTDNRVLFKMLYPDNETEYIIDIENNQLVLGPGILSQDGIYKIELASYPTDGRVTAYATMEFYVRKELISTDEIVEPDDRVPILDNLINEVDNINISATKEDDVATITVTKKDGTTDTVEIYDGEIGPQGPKGDKGDKGDTGERGPQGIQGPKGDTGPQGAKGDKGDKGDTGSQGPIGPTGPTGPQGSQGPKGDKGDTGSQGPTGPQGPQGPKGDPGLTEQEVQDMIDVSIEALGEIGFTPTVVEELPTHDIDEHTIYLVPKEDEETDDVYDEWLYISNNWEHVGSTSVDLSNYYTKDNIYGVPTFVVDFKGVDFQSGGTIYNNEIKQQCEAAMNFFASKQTSYGRLILINCGGGEKVLELTNTNRSLEVRATTTYRFDTLSTYTRIGADADRDRKISIKGVQMVGNWSGDTFTLTSLNKITIEYNMLDYIKFSNTTSFTPTGDYNPATKKYVDDSVNGFIPTLVLSDVPTRSWSGGILTDSDLLAFFSARINAMLTENPQNGLALVKYSNSTKTELWCCSTNVSTSTTQYDYYLVNKNAMIGNGSMSNDYCYAVRGRWSDGVYECTYIATFRNPAPFPSSNQVLTKTNNDSYTPSSNYHPSTKLYTDLKYLQTSGLTAYSSSTTYNTGDYVYRSDTNPNIYRCKEDSVTGTWDNTKWELKTYFDYMRDNVGTDLSNYYTKSEVDNKIQPLYMITVTDANDISNVHASSQMKTQIGNIVTEAYAKGCSYFILALSFSMPGAPNRRTFVFNTDYGYFPNIQDKPNSITFTNVNNAVNGFNANNLSMQSVNLTFSLTWNGNIASVSSSSYSSGYANILTTSNTRSFTPTSNYHPATKKYVDDNKGQTIQYTTMPTAADTNVGQVAQYIGTTDNTYTNGYFYQVVSDGGDPATYSWEQIEVQPSGGTRQYFVYNTSMTASEKIEFFQEWVDYALSTGDYTSISAVASNNGTHYYICDMKWSLNSYTIFFGGHDSGSASYDSDFQYINIGITLQNGTTVTNVSGGMYVYSVPIAKKYTSNGAGALYTNNYTQYTPTGDYNPATKKYVDDSIASAITDALGGSY